MTNPNTRRAPGANVDQRLTIPLLGIEVTPMSATDVVDWVLSRTEKSLLLNHNLHSAYLYVEDERFRSVYELADRIIIDGAPILWLAKLASKHQLSADARIGSTDWIALLKDAECDPSEQRTIAVYGASADANRAAVSALSASLASIGWVIRGLNGFVPPGEAVDWLQQLRPDLVIVGLGMPRQEHFLLDHWEALPAATYATVGGAIDYVGGSNRLSPRWVGRIGLEWLWRLVHEPYRLAHRYLVEPFLLLAAVARQRGGTPHPSKTRHDSPSNTNGA